MDSSVGRLSVRILYLVMLAFCVMSIEVVSSLFSMVASIFLCRSVGSSGISSTVFCLFAGRFVRSLIIFSLVDSADSPLLMWLVPQRMA